MPSRKSDARRSIGDDHEMPPVQHDAPAPPSEALAAAHLTSATPSSAPSAPPAPPESTTTGGGGGDHKGKSKADPDTITIEDLTLPKSIITRLAKGVLPPNTQIQANAILALSKSATVFINHLANAANEITLMSGKKTIMPPDVFRALDDVEYGFMRDRLEAEFASMWTLLRRFTRFQEATGELTWGQNSTRHSRRNARRTARRSRLRRRHNNRGVAVRRVRMSR
jgi:histone H3/H4